MVDYVLATIDRKLGRCPKCFRLSFLGAVLGWILVTALHMAGAPPQVLLPVLTWPVAFTVLWLAHLVTFAGRNLKSAKALDGVANIPLLGANARVITRRDSIRLFARSVQFAAFVSAAPLVTAVLSACGGGGSYGGVGGNACTAAGLLSCNTSNGLQCGYAVGGSTGYGCYAASSGAWACCVTQATASQWVSQGLCTGAGYVLCR